MNENNPTAPVMGPKRANMKVVTYKVPEHEGDNEKLNFQKNIIENIVGVELDELSEEEDKKPEAHLEKTLHRPISPGESSDQPSGTAELNQIASNPPMTTIAPEGTAIQTTGRASGHETHGQTAAHEVQNNPDQIAAEIQANIQEESGDTGQVHPFLKYMLIMGVYNWTFVIAGLSAWSAGSGRIRGVLWGSAAASLTGLLKALAAVRCQPPRSKFDVLQQLLSTSRYLLLSIASVGGLGN